MENRKTELRQAAARGASGDNAARFLRELRQLRSGAGLGHAELAARSHYPYDRIRAAEAGPALPDLPVLSAYVAGCGGTTEEWEERWRMLHGSPALPVLPTRSAGCSVLAARGARLGSARGTIGPRVSTDPSTVMAALDRTSADTTTAVAMLQGYAAGADAPFALADYTQAAWEVAPSVEPLAGVPTENAARVVPTTDAGWTADAVRTGGTAPDEDTAAAPALEPSADMPTGDAVPTADAVRTGGTAPDEDTAAAPAPEPSADMPTGDAPPAADVVLPPAARAALASVPRQARAAPPADPVPAADPVLAVNAAADGDAVQAPGAVPAVNAAADGDVVPDADAIPGTDGVAAAAAVPAPAAGRTAWAVPVTTAWAAPKATVNGTAGGASARAAGRRALPPRAQAALIVATVCVVFGLLLFGVLTIFS